jgi:hypothetical protein
MKRTALLFLLSFLLSPIALHASCSGSGLTWSCTAGSTNSQVQTAINSASNGATITFAAGAYTITGWSLNNRNGITLICASVGACTSSSNGDLITVDFCNGANVTGLIRISGFSFSGTPGSGTITAYCSDNFNITQFRIDHNTFSGIAGTQGIIFGEISKTSVVYGVVDHNTFTGSDNGMAMKNLSGGLTWTTGRKGTGNNMFFEDNIITSTTNTNLGLSGVDVWRANGTVLRFNTVTNTRMESHSLCHGGPTNLEVYNNTISDTAGSNYRNIHSQGSGEITFFNNTVESAGDGNAIALQHYRSDHSQLPQGACDDVGDPDETCDGDFSAGSGIPQTDGNRVGGFGYPCWHQPGRDGAATLKPVYTWNNRTAGGTLVQVDIQSGSYADLGTCANNDSNRINCHIRRDRDIYFSASTAQTSATSPFNGTTGVGYGTIARRPTTCTAGPGGLDGTNGGVAYWATDEGEWDSSNGATADGQMYRCSATNTWTLEYTPYTYPHPLVSGADTTNPTPGNSGTVTLSGVTATGMTLTFTKASDDTSSAANLQYEICRATGSLSAGVSACEAATIVQSFTTDASFTCPSTCSYNATGLSASMTYYWNIVVKDEAGNTAAYTVANQATSAPTPTGMGPMGLRLRLGRRP